MKDRRIVLFLPALVLLCAAGAGAQNRAEAQAAPAAASAVDSAQAESGPAIFPLIPLLEAAFSGELRWRPDWPVDFPPDAFSLAAGGQTGRALVISLSNDTDSYTFMRNGAGRLREFPFFSPSGLLQVEAIWAASGALRGLKVNAAAADSETAWDFTFPPDFSPFSGIFPGGDFSPVQVSANNADFFVLVRENPRLLTETWYDGQGNLVAFFKAPVLESGGRSFVQGLQTPDTSNPGFTGWRGEDYFFDAGGNISEIRSPAGTFSAQYEDRRPRYWNLRIDASGGSLPPSDAAPPAVSEEPPLTRLALQWDARLLLVNMRPVDEPLPAAPVEYRYEYELDADGNWVKRQDIEMISQFGVFFPRPGKTWVRDISFTEHPAQLPAELPAQLPAEE
jgi:hypothetical protein